MIVAGLSGLFGIAQTQFFTTFFNGHSLEHIRKTIGLDKTKQHSIYNEYCSRNPKEWARRGITFYSPFFHEKELRMLETAKNALLSDQDLQAQLTRDFGSSFAEVNAFILPAWKLHNDWNRDVIGVTKSGREGILSPAGDPNILGFTMRDRHDVPIQLTTDGTPRVALNLEAFKSQNMLQLTLYHELLHALNVPSHEPPKITLLQTDLTYLESYRNYVNNRGLGSSGERWIWVLGVCAPWFIFLVALRHVIGERRRKRVLSSV